MTKIDVVTTAIRRPEILDLAYRSYFNGGILDLPKLRIILNIDPIGAGSEEEMVSIAKSYSDEVVVNSPENSNFANAINWCWSQVESKHFLHLEDDWLLTNPIKFHDWLKSLEQSNALQSVLIRKHRRQIPAKYSFRANLARKSVIDQVGLIPPKYNPEKWCIQRLGMNVSIDFGPERQLIDMGRKWAKGNQSRKSTGSSGLRITSESLASGWFGERPSGIVGRLDYKMNYNKWQRVLRAYENDFKDVESI